MSRENLERMCRSALQTLRLALGEYTAATGELPYFLLDGQNAELSEASLAGCQVVPSRYHLVRRLPPQARVIEIGTQTGAFAKFLMDTLQPREMHVVDIDLSLFKSELFSEEDRARLKIHEGLSWEVPRLFPQHYFDLAYIDASHAYESVTKDLEACLDAVKPGGLIICNDFVSWSPFEATPYGVPKAVTELVARHGFQVKYLALHPAGYQDLAFETRKLKVA